MLADGSTPDPDAHVESGHIQEVIYAGMVTRYIVELDAGGRLVVVRQNLETTSAEALEDRGKHVRLEWRPEHEFEIEDGGETEERTE
jgi:putative spermidine/putrescine transport system ATP-binding protein